MKTVRLTLTVAALLMAAPVFASNNATSSAATQAQSSAANQGNNQAITFEGSHYPTHSRVDSPPVSYGAPSAFGFSQNNCGGSDTVGIGTWPVAANFSHAKPMFDCNVRADTIILWQLGLHVAATLRMACFGSDAVRMAYEASGHTCPASGTAKGISGAPVGPKFEVAAIVPKTMHGTIEPNGQVKWEK